MWFFKQNKTLDYDSILSKLRNGFESDIQEMLWQPKNGKINYLPLTVKLIQRLKALSDNDKLTIHTKKRIKNFELIIFNLTWITDDIPYSPLIFELNTGKIVGILLPFNELHGFLSQKESATVSKLGLIWIKFTFQYKFK
jgi:hypothetical protein